MVKGQKANYQNTVIYKIVCDDLTIKSLYVGHTTNWIKRKSAHKCNCNNEKRKAYNSKKYTFIRENGGWENWSMIEICKYPCSDKREAEAEERRHYEILNADLNDIRPLITSIERKEQQEFSNKHRHEKIAQKQRETYQKNKEEINRKRREKYKEKTLLQTVVVLD
tara:strand:+ start:1221 stop:1718 length:498 start_codon:yes stop_codon:yes gene_type:complete